MYFKLPDTFPYTDEQLRRDNPDTSFPAVLTDDIRAAFGVVSVTPAEKPAHDPLTQACTATLPLEVDGVWFQQWTVTSLDTETAEANTARAETNRIARLWQAAHDYEFAQVSGSAIGLLAMGVMLGKPKCLAVQAWIKSIWTEYYVRGATGSTDYDFSFAGACPHRVPELMAELGL